MQRHTEQAAMIVSAMASLMVVGFVVTYRAVCGFIEEVGH